VAIASSLGLGHVKVPIVRHSISASTATRIHGVAGVARAIMEEIVGDRLDPMVTALALARVVAKRRKGGAER